MAVAVRGYTPLSWVATELHDLAIPVAAVAGDLVLAWLFDPDAWKGGGPVDKSGWTYHDRDMWTKVLTAADVAAGAVAVRASGSALLVYSGAGGTARSYSSEYLRPAVAGAGLFWFAFLNRRYSGDPAGSTYRLGTVVTASDGYKHSIHSRMVASAGTYALDNVHRAAGVYGVVVDPIAAPLAPTITGPAAGSAVDRTAPVTLTFTHRSSSGLPQTSARARIRVVGAGTWSYVQPDGSLGATEADTVTGLGQLTVAAGALTAGARYEWAPSSSDDGGPSPYALSQEFTAHTPPTLVVTLTTSHGNLAPVSSWVTTPGTGEQTAWEARVVPAADTAPTAPTVGSGPASGTDTAWTPAPSDQYENGGSYKGWVRVRDGALWSAWTPSAAKTVSWTAPAAPTSVTFVQGSPPVLAVAGIAAGAEGVEAQWTDEEGAWETIATATPTGATMNVPVPRAGYGLVRSYRARITGTVGDVLLPSAWATVAAPVASADRAEYLVDPTNQTDYLPVKVHVDDPRQHLEGISSTSGLAADHLRVDYTPPVGWAGRTEYLAESLAERVALLDWLQAHPQYWMEFHPEWEDGALVRVPGVLARRVSPVSEARLVQYVYAHRHIPVSWVTP
jgi:hypothetical protein